MEVLDNPSYGQRSVEDIKAKGYDFKFGDYVGGAIDILKKNPGLFFAYAIVGVIIGAVPFLNYVAMSGFFIAARKVRRNEPLAFEDFFGGFKEPVFVPLLVTGIVAPLIVVVGMFLCILPGIYLAVGYFLVIPMILWYTNDFWQALEASRKVVTKNWFMFFVFAIVVGFLAQLGVILCGIGLFLTLPLYFLATYCAYEDIVGFRD